MEFIIRNSVDHLDSAIHVVAPEIWIQVGEILHQFKGNLSLFVIDHFNTLPVIPEAWLGTKLHRQVGTATGPDASKRNCSTSDVPIYNLKNCVGNKAASWTLPISSAKLTEKKQLAAKQRDPGPEVEMSTKQKEELQRLIAQAEAISTMMLTLMQAIFGDYPKKRKGSKHDIKIGRIGREMLVAFVLWKEDTVLKPKKIAAIARYLKESDKNVSRDLEILIEIGLVCAVDGGFARDITYIEARLDKKNGFEEMRKSVVKAAKELIKIFDMK